MIRKFLKLNICIIAILCMFCSSLTVFAEPGDLDFDFNIQPEIPTTQEETISVETEKETEKQTEKETEKQTEKETKPRPTQSPTQRPTQRPTPPQTTERVNHQPDNNSWGDNDNDNDNDVQVNAQTTEAESTTVDPDEEKLKDGMFYVYLERNNGQRRLKTLMTQKGYVSEPEEPMREGYIFAGWYSDAKFKKPWDFMTDIAEGKMTIYAKWTAIGDTVVYDIIIEDSVGGALEVNPQKASMGEPVMITVVPDEGKRLVKGSVLINGKSTDFLNFVMPDGDVTISASFEDIPQDEIQQSKSKLPFIIVFVVIAVIIVIVAVVIVRKRNDFNADLDPDEDVFAPAEDEGDVWIDESIVIEDGFVEGKKIVENTEPDYGAPDSEEDEE